MPTLDTQGISLHYEVHGNRANPPLLLISGLGGVATSWGPLIERFAEKYFVVVADQRGTGKTTLAADGYSTQQIAADMASLVEHLALGAVHVVGSSTGGAIAQYMALDHRNTVRSLTISSSFARFDAFVQREFEVRRQVSEQLEPQMVYACHSLFLFSPRYTRNHPEKVQQWIDRAASRYGTPESREIASKRIAMVAAHDALPRLGAITQPTLVLCGDHNFCTPLPLSEEIARAVPGAELVIFPDAGELIEIEKEAEFFQTVSAFIDRHTGRR